MTPPPPTAHILSNRLDLSRLIDTCKLAPDRWFGLWESEEGCRARLSWRTACTTGVTDCLCSDEVSAMVCNRNSNKFRREFKDWMHYTGLGVIHKCLAVCVHTSTRCGDYLHIHRNKEPQGELSRGELSCWVIPGDTVLMRIGWGQELRTPRTSPNVIPKTGVPPISRMISPTVSPPPGAAVTKGNSP